MVLRWINNISTYTLMTIASFGGVATVTMGLMARNRINDNVKKTEYFKEALACVRMHKGAISLLGEPIKDLRIQVGDLSRNFTKGDQAQYEVPVSGSKQKGVIYFWAEREKSENNWTVSRIELELKNDPYRRLLIKGTQQE